MGFYFTSHKTQNKNLSKNVKLDEKESQTSEKK